MKHFITILTLPLIFCCGSVESQDEKNSNSVNKIFPQPQLPANAVLAPEFTLSTTSGDLVKMSDLKGKVVLLNFWGTWCGPCRVEIPDFIRLYDKYHESGLEIVGITLPRGARSEDPKQIQRFMDNWQMNYTVLTDIKEHEAQRVTQLYGQALGRSIVGIPTTLIIDRNGYIVKRYVGPRTEKIFYNDIKPYL